MALTLFLIFTIVWLFWHNTKLYRTNTILRDEIKKRNKIIEELCADLKGGTQEFYDLTKKFNKLVQSHNAYVKEQKKKGDGGTSGFIPIGVN